jgi:transcriptional regulator with XRE-family HTH domain
MRCIICIISVIYAQMILMDRDSILKKIKIKRVTLGFSQDDVAQALGMDESQYSRLENGKSQLDLNRLIPLLAFLGMKWSDFDENEILPGTPNLDSPENLKREIKAISEMMKTLAQEVNNLKKKELNDVAG